MVKVSIIVPVYNSEKYLNKCLDSLVSQTLKNIEIIIIIAKNIVLNIIGVSSLLIFKLLFIIISAINQATNITQMSNILNNTFLYFFITFILNNIPSIIISLCHPIIK